MILLISPKHVYATKRFKQEALKSGLALEVLDLRDLARKNFIIDTSKYNALFVRSAYPYFNQVISLAKQFKAEGKKVIDESIAEGDLGLGKMASYEKISGAGLPVPKTAWLKDNSFEYPYIVKWNYGFGGKEVFLIRRPADLEKVLESFPKEELLAQELIPAEYEYKIITVGFVSLPVGLKFKTNPKNFRPDFKQSESVATAPDGDFEAVSAARLAEQASFLLKRELAKVDILKSRSGLFILEANRWPGLKSFEAVSGCNAAAEFVGYIKAKSGLPKVVESGIMHR